MIKFFKHLAVVTLLLSTQISLLPTLPGVYKNLNIVVVVLVFTCVVYRFYLGVVYGLFVGFVLDLYSVLPFGVIIISLMITLFIVYNIFEHLLTNKSFYTLIGLSILATLLYSFILFGFRAAVYFSMTKDLGSVQNFGAFYVNDLLWQLLFNVVLTIVMFIIFHASSRRFKAVFVDTVKG